ncbi:MAG: hypothetical protein F4117_10250 [Acidimicrobiales bacterium]|nr:hypothetical protein [Acidimicrobiales bacterium]MYB82768.1 hypothetical protein [Acidimicrobiales bacterium]MYI12934.1 hypothetical protein [Acidimicrobiales bacterium]
MSSTQPPAEPAPREVGHSTQWPRRCDERGGTVSLMVILLTPMLAFAAIAAAAVPQRLAAQAAVDDTAGELASMAAVWRTVQAQPHDPADWFFPDCTQRHSTPPEDPESLADPSRDPQQTPDDPSAAGPDALEGHRTLRDACITTTRSLLAGLGARGVDADRLAGYYTSGFSTIAPPAGDVDHPSSVPCRISVGIVASDAVHLGITADWGAGRWAPAQIWPDGIVLHSHTAAYATQPSDTEDPDQLPGCAPPRSPAMRALADRAPTRTAFGSPVAP